MKILYIASERSRAQVATRALRTISPNVTVLWGSSYERAAFGVLENPDLAALIVEVQSDSQGCFYLKQLHTLGLLAPVVIVMPEGAGSPVESLKAGADDYVVKGPSFSQELPAVVSRAIGHEQAPAPTRSNERRSETVAERAVGVPIERRSPPNVSPTRETERRVTDAPRDQRGTTEQSAAAGSQAKLEMLLRQEHEIRTGLEQKLAEARAALQDAEQRHLSATTSAAAQLGERTTQYESGIARAAATQRTLEEQLRQSRQSRAIAVADVERLTRRNSELTSMLTEATAAGNTLERRLADIETALEAANARASRDQMGAAEQAAGRQAELHAQLKQEVEKRRHLEEELARAKTTLENTENQRSSVMTAATELWAERQAQFDAELTTAAEARNALGREARQLEAALDQARQTIQAHTATVARLTQREAALTSQLAEAAGLRSTLEQQLTAATDALKDAEDGTRRDRLAAETRAAGREVEFDGLIRHERATRTDVEQRLAQVEAALREAEQQHASTIAASTTNVDRLTQREAELTSQLADAAASRSALERQLTDAADALNEARDGASRGRLAAATERAERQAQFESELSQTAAARDEFERRFGDAETALAAARHDHEAAATEVGRLTQREAELTSQLAQAAAMRNTLERQLSEAATALKDAEEGASRDLRHERATRTDVEQRLAQVEAALRKAEQQHASAIAASTTKVERLTQQEAALTSQLAEAAALRSTLERQLTTAADALKDAEEGTRRDRLAAETKAAERELEIEGLIGHERAMRANVEHRLAQVETALRDGEQQHASAMTAAAAERAERQGQFEIELSQTAATRDEFKRRFSDAENALAAARRDHAEAATEVERLTRRETEVTSQLAQAEADLREAEHQHTSAMTAAATDRSELQAQFDAELSQTSAARDEFQRRFSDTETALAAARHDHAVAATEVERLTQREAELTSQLAEAAAMRSTLERQLTDAATALKAADEGAARDRLAAEVRAAEREAEFGGLIRDERAMRADVEQRLAQVEANLRETEHQHTLAMAAAATERAERQAQFESELSQTAAARDEFQRRFSDTETALAAARHDHAVAATEVERLTQREAKLTSQLTHAEATLRNAEQQHASAMTAATTERAELQAQFDAELSQTSAARDEFQRQFRDTETALAAARHDHAVATTEVERLTQREAELTSQLAEAAAMRNTLERQLTDAAAALKAADEGAARDRLAAETRAAEREAEFGGVIRDERAMRADVEQRLGQEIARREALDRTVAEMGSAAADAEQRFREEIATLTTRGRHQVTQLEHDFAREREAHKERQTRLLNEIHNLEAARGALDESLASVREQSRLREIDYHNERDGLERARLAAETEVRRLAAELTDARHNLEEARKNFQHTLDCVSNEHADSQAKLLATVAERDTRIEEVEKQLDENRLELRRQFLRAPLPLWRCTRDGALTHANRALADLVGYRQPDELRGDDFVKTVFESTDDLSWLIERCFSTKKRESVETAWKRKSGERLVVRLSAIELPPDMIEIAVEDVTNARVLEDRLARAHRMEAVARLASEIAVTCGRLLGDVHEDGQQWLMEVSDDTALRRRGERLLGEVARAASYLERLAAHGDEQTSALKPVELNRVLRDLKPVLKHVAGDDVELELSKTSSALSVDMKADRVERLFVNLASYGRERMPGGGRLRIELDTVVVDQKFIADHPNVRRGHHALITITTVRRGTPTAETLHGSAIEPTPSEVVSEKPGVDLGALQELLQECGGHLWLTVDPPGNMVVKIRLPLRVWDDRPHPTTSDTPTTHDRVIAETPSSRKGVMPRWFRH